MTGQPNADTDPLNAFWMPGRDIGLARLGPPAAAWNTISGGTTDTVTLAEHPRIQRRWRKEWQNWQSETVFAKPVEYNTHLAVAQNISFTDQLQAVNGKWLLNGPSGHRAIGHNFRAIKRAFDRPTWVEKFATFIAAARSQTAELPAHTDAITGLDAAIEARNLDNYFHVVREIFPIFALLANTPAFNGRIKIVTNKTELPGFFSAHIQDLFPEFVDKIDLLPAPQTFETVLIAYHQDVEYFMTQNAEIDGVIGPDNSLANDSFPPRLPKVLLANGNPSALRLLRERALEKIAGRSLSHLPKRFWLGRRPKPGHDRSIKAEAKVLEVLAARGFEPLYFEDLGPLDQIGALQNAEIMISPHGAGFTNMLYAAPTSHIIELGTFQTGAIRWDDFASLAHISGCRYTVAIADYEYDGPEIIPSHRGKGIYPVRMSDHAIDKLTAYLDSL